MATIKTFEEIEAWKQAREFCKMIYDFIQRDAFSKDYKLKEQLNGSSGSIMDNIAEGFERGGNKEFVNFLRYSKGSSGESRSQLYRALDRNYINTVEFNAACEIARSISSKNQKLISYLNDSELKGPNYISKNK